MSSDPNSDNVKLKVIERWQLIKWDGEAPFVTDDPEVAKQHPQCAEIVQGGDDIPTTVIYRRSE